jgi:hypothetical protein
MEDPFPGKALLSNRRDGHSLKSSWGALSDGTISFSIQPFSGEKYIIWNFLINNILNNTPNEILQI